MLALTTEIETLDGTVKTISQLIDEADNGIENHVYTCDLDGRITPSKVLFGNTAQSPTVDLMFNHGLSLNCTADHEFPVHSVGYKQATDLTPTDIVAGCRFNLDNTLIFEHNTKIFIHSDYLVNEAYNLYQFLYEPRDILNWLPEEAGGIHEHLWIISTITITKDQLCNRLANDGFLKEMLSVAYLTHAEVATLIDHFELEYKDKTLSQDEIELSQLLNVNTPEAPDGRLDGLLENLQGYTGDLFANCGIEVDGELTVDHLCAAAMLVGYSNADHLTSVNHMHGSRVNVILPGINTDVGTLVLEHGETIGIHNGVFVNI
jgi:hypothetical protein